MPRNKRHGSVTAEENSSVSTITSDMTPSDTQENDPMTTATDTETEQDATPTFEFEIFEAPEDYEPERKNPGRARKPSFFDGPLAEKKGLGWQIVPYKSEEHKTAILRELTRAKGHVGVGLDLFDNVEENQIEWKSRDVRPRERKAQAETNGQTDTGDVDE